MTIAIFSFLLVSIGVYLFFVAIAAKLFKKKEKYEAEKEPFRFDS